MIKLRIDEIKNHVGKFILVKKYGSSETKRIYVSSCINGVVSCESMRGKTVEYFRFGDDYSKKAYQNFDIFLEE